MKYKSKLTEKLTEIDVTKGVSGIMGGKFDREDGAEPPNGTKCECDKGCPTHENGKCGNDAQIVWGGNAICDYCSGEGPSSK